MANPYGQTVGGLLMDAASSVGRFAKSNPLDAAAIATMPVPIVGDIAGLLADADMYYNEPEQRTLLNLGLSSLGVLPLVPPVVSMRKGAGYLGDPRLIKNPRAVREAGDDITEEAIGQGGKLIKTGSKTYKAGKDYKKDLSEMDFEFTPTEGGLMVPRSITPEEMVGSGGNVLLPLLGDRTSAGGKITSIGGRKLDNPVNMQGGADYARSRAQMDDGSVWASAENVPKRIQGQIDAAGKEADSVYLGYSSMGGRSGDASTHMSDAIMGQLKINPVSKKAAKKFDDELRKVWPDWTGINSKKTQELLDTTKQKNRKLFAELMEKDEYQKLGFPNIAETRLAITDPDKLHLPAGYGGQMISKGIPDADINLDPSFAHKTYDKTIRGEYMGGLDEPLPRQVMFPEFHKTLRKEGRHTKEDYYNFERRGPVQRLDQEWLDGVMQYYDDLQAGKFD